MLHLDPPVGSLAGSSTAFGRFLHIEIVASASIPLTSVVAAAIAKDGHTNWESAMAEAGAGEIYPGVTVDPRVVHGKPVLTGTRVPVALVVGQLAGGESMESVCANYEVTPEQVRAALGYAASRVEAETVYVVVGA